MIKKDKVTVEANEKGLSKFILARICILLVIITVVFSAIIIDMNTGYSSVIFNNNNKVIMLKPDTDKNEATPSSQVNTADSNTTKNNGFININSADLAELTGLDGIGEKTAQKIIEYRKANGGFKKVEDIMKVDGIGNKKFDAIKNKITI